MVDESGCCIQGWSRMIHSLLEQFDSMSFPNQGTRIRVGKLHIARASSYPPRPKGESLMLLPTRPGGNMTCRPALVGCSTLAGGILRIAESEATGKWRCSLGERLKYRGTAGKPDGKRRNKPQPQHRKKPAYSPDSCRCSSLHPVIFASQALPFIPPELASFGNEAAITSGTSPLTPIQVKLPRRSDTVTPLKNSPRKASTKPCRTGPATAPIRSQSSIA